MTRQRAWILVRLVLALVAVVALWRAVDWSQIGAVASALNPAILLGVVLCGTGSRLTGVIRWNVLCGGLLPRAPGVPRLFRLGLLAEFVNIWVPSFVGGEVVRIMGVKEHGDVVSATWSVGIDRVLGLAGLLLSIVPLAFLIELPIPQWATGVGLVGVVGGLVVAFAIRPFLLTRGGWAAALAGLSVPRTLGALALSTLSPWCLVAGYTLFFSALHPLGTVEIAAFVLLSRFGRAVPIQLFGVNSVEGTMWVLGELLGIPREVLVLSVAMNVSDKFVHSMVGGLVELAVNGTGALRRLRTAEEAG
jgi:hypothetical protein